MRTLTLTSYAPMNLNGSPDKATPNYPKFGATVAKYRKLPPTPENIKAHAAALFSQLATFQRAKFRASATEPERACPCASGTWHTDGRKILKAVNDANRRALDGALAESWRKRTDAQVGAAYLAAMAGKDAPLTYLIHTR